MSAPVILLGHGSPDPRAAAALRTLAREVARQRPETRVEVAFLDHDDPGLTGLAIELAWAGYGSAVVVPAFLSTAFHVRVDVPDAVAAAERSSGLRLVVAEPIGPDPALLDLLDGQLPDGPVVLACAGTRDEPALAGLRDLARQWADRRGGPVELAYASSGGATPPDVATALAWLEADGTRASVASFTLLPGVLPDRIAAAAADRVCTAPFGAGATHGTARIVLDRVDAAA